MIVILLYSHHLPADIVLVLLGEILSWSLVGVKGLIMEAQWIPILSLLSKWYYPQSTTILHHRTVENYFFFFISQGSKVFSVTYIVYWSTFYKYQNL